MASTVLVALLAEGVDKNIDAAIKEMDEVASPSSRRAWIEISSTALPISAWSPVALLTEGVDRNMPRGNNNYGADRRPPHGGRG